VRVKYNDAMAVVKIDADGRLTVPEDALRALGVEGESEVLIEIDAEHETVVLRPADDDSWLDTPETIAAVRRAEADIAAGRMRTASPADFRALAETEDE
jgi:bifunctional DNA-binding transcriptional regulator/antitoxin component of YhaV-PrlF toxin-antitoxin module